MCLFSDPVRGLLDSIFPVKLESIEIYRGCFLLLALVWRFRNDTVRCYVGLHAHPRMLVEVVLASVDNAPLV